MLATRLLFTSIYTILFSILSLLFYQPFFSHFYSSFPIIVLLLFHQFFSSLSWAHLVPIIVYLTFTLPKTIPLPFSTLSSPYFYSYKFAYSFCISLPFSECMFCPQKGMSSLFNFLLSFGGSF